MLLKRGFFFILLISCFTTRSQTIISDTILDINCYHNGAIYTNIESLDTNVFTKWYYSEDNYSWVFLDTSSSVVSLNNTNFNSDTLVTLLCGYYKLEAVNVIDTLLESRIYYIKCELLGFADVEIIECDNNFGSISIDSISGGVSPFIFQWYYNNMIFDTLNSVDSLDEGLYTAIIVDSLGCTDSLSIMLSSPNQLIIDTIIVNSVRCNEDSTGSFFLSISGGRKFTESNRYRYYLLNDANDTISQSDTNNITQNFQQIATSLSMLSSFADSIEIVQLISDSFRLVVLDSSSCLIDTIIFISQPDPYTLYPGVNSTLELCSSDSSWFVIDSIKGGNLPFLYSIGNTNNYNIATSHILNDSIFISSGDYNLYVYDTINSCQDTLLFSILSTYDVQANISVDNVLCYGDSTGAISIDSIFGGSLPYSLNWYGVNPNHLFSGIYPVEIIDSLSCIFRDTLLISQLPPVLADPTIEYPICYSDTNASIRLTILGGLFPYAILWDNGLDEDTLLNLSSGSYSYTITDSNGCIFSDTIQVIDPSPIDIQFINYSDSLLCFGAQTTIEAFITGYDSAYSIIWSNNDTLVTTTIFSGLTTCTITDNNNCMLIDSVIIFEPDTFRISDLIMIDTLCNDGVSLSVSTTGGTSPFNYQWSTGDTIKDVIINDSITSCWVIVTDSCGGSDSIGINLMPFVLETSLYYNDSSHIASVEINNTSSSGPFIYIWEHLRLDSISLDSFMLINPCEEIYYVSIIDSINGCFVTDTLNAYLYLPDSLIDLSVISVIPSLSLWGYSPYTYLWDDGTILPHADLCSGDHWVEVTDNTGCLIREDFTIDPLVITLEPSGPIIECNLENLDIDMNAIIEGGTSPYNYEWSNGSVENPLNFALNPGNYSITIRDNNNCIEDTTFSIAIMTSECVPNIFSPNGDNMNDTWSLENTFLYPDSEVKIYSRYGRLLFYSVGYQSNWDGKDEKGADLSDGVYFYTIEIGNGFDPIKGTITIIR